MTTTGQLEWDRQARQPTTRRRRVAADSGPDARSTAVIAAYIDDWHRRRSEHEYLIQSVLQVTPPGPGSSGASPRFSKRTGDALNYLLNRRLRQFCPRISLQGLLPLPFFF
jgi:hypothetical protein